MKNLLKRAGCSEIQVTLAERLGFKPTDRILIINGDDVGMCHTADVATIEAMERGLMESYFKPTDELKAITGSWTTRSEEFETFTNDPEIRRIVAEQKIILIGYWPLRDLQRKGKNKKS